MSQDEPIPAGNRFPQPFYESVLRCPEPICRWRIKAEDPDRYELYAKHYRAEHIDGGDRA